MLTLNDIFILASSVSFLRGRLPHCSHTHTRFICHWMVSDYYSGDAGAIYWDLGIRDYLEPWASWISRLYRVTSHLRIWHYLPSYPASCKNRLRCRGQLQSTFFTCYAATPPWILFAPKHQFSNTNIYWLGARAHIHTELLIVSLAGSTGWYTKRRTFPQISIVTSLPSTHVRRSSTLKYGR